MVVFGNTFFIFRFVKLNVPLRMLLLFSAYRFPQYHQEEMHRKKWIWEDC